GSGDHSTRRGRIEHIRRDRREQSAGVRPRYRTRVVAGRRDRGRRRHDPWPTHPTPPVGAAQRSVRHPGTGRRRNHRDDRANRGVRPARRVGSRGGLLRHPHTRRPIQPPGAAATTRPPRINWAARTPGQEDTPAWTARGTSWTGLTWPSCTTLSCPGWRRSWPGWSTHPWTAPGHRQPFLSSPHPTSRALNSKRCWTRWIPPSLTPPKPQVPATSVTFPAAGCPAPLSESSWHG